MHASVVALLALVLGASGVAAVAIAAGNVSASGVKKCATCSCDCSWAKPACLPPSKMAPMPKYYPYFRVNCAPEHISGTPFTHMNVSPLARYWLLVHM